MKKFVNKESVLEVAKGFIFTDKTQKRQYMDFLEYCLDNAIVYDLDKVIKELEECMEKINNTECPPNSNLSTCNNFASCNDCKKEWVLNIVKSNSSEMGCE